MARSSERQFVSYTCAILEDGDTVTLEPWRAKAFPVIKDLVVDRSALDRISAAGGYVSVKTGAAPDANAVLVAKPDADTAFDYATCIACGACVAACPNASASLFTAAKISHLALLAQGQPERKKPSGEDDAANDPRRLWRLLESWRMPVGVS